MELVKSKGMIVFFVVVLSITIVSSLNTKKYDERSENLNNSYVAINLK